MYEYICKKCGNVCDVEWDGCKPLSWCEECRDYPAGFWEKLSEIQAEHFGAIADQRR